MIKNNIEIVQVPLVDLKITDYNPRKWDESQKKELKDSITRFGVVDALIVNSADDRKNVILGGHFRFEVLKELEYTEVPVIYLNIPDLEREKELVIWHLNNRMQGFAAKYKFFNKYDFAIVGTEGNVELNAEPEDVPLFQEEYETALFATSGNPTWESYEKGKKYCPTDFIEYKASDEKSSGQGIIFGTKPIEILVPYIKVLTKRGDVVAEPFGGSGSTLIASVKMGRRCFIMEKSPTYAEVILNRWEKLTGKKRVKISQNHE